MPSIRSSTAFLKEYLNEHNPCDVGTEQSEVRVVTALWAPYGEFMIWIVHLHSGFSGTDLHDMT